MSQRLAQREQDIQQLSRQLVQLQSVLEQSAGLSTPSQTQMPATSSSRPSWEPAAAPLRSAQPLTSQPTPRDETAARLERLERMIAQLAEAKSQPAPQAEPVAQTAPAKNYYSVLEDRYQQQADENAALRDQMTQMQMMLMQMVAAQQSDAALMTSRQTQSVATPNPMRQRDPAPVAEPAGHVQLAGYENRTVETVPAWELQARERIDTFAEAAQEKVVANPEPVEKSATQDDEKKPSFTSKFKKLFSRN